MGPPSREVKELVDACERAGDITTFSYPNGYNAFYTDNLNQIYYKMAGSQRWLDEFQKFSYSITPTRIRWLITALVPPFGPLVILTPGATIKRNLRIWTAREGFEHDLGEVEKWYGGHDYRGPRSLQTAAEEQHGSGIDASWESMVPASRGYRSSEPHASSQDVSHVTYIERNSASDESIDELSSASDDDSVHTSMHETNADDNDEDYEPTRKRDFEYTSTTESGGDTNIQSLPRTRSSMYKSTEHSRGQGPATNTRQATQVAPDRVRSIARADAEAESVFRDVSTATSSTAVDSPVPARQRPLQEASPQSEIYLQRSIQQNVNHHRLKRFKPDSTSPAIKVQDTPTTLGVDSTLLRFYNGNNEMARAKSWSGCNTIGRLFEHARVAKSVPRGVDVSTLVVTIEGEEDTEIMEGDQEDFDRLVHIIEARVRASLKTVVEIRGV